MDSNQVYSAANQPIPPAVDNGTQVFTGRFGLRAVWGVLLFIALFTTSAFTLSGVIRLAYGKSFLPHKAVVTQSKAATVDVPDSAKITDVRAGSTTLADAVVLAALAIACWILARIERRRIGVFGIGTNRGRDFFAGAFWGLITMTLLVGTLYKTHVLMIEGRIFRGSIIYVHAAEWLLAFLFVGLSEEYLNRGYLQYTLTRGMYTMAERISPKNARAIAFWAAAIVMSCLFGAGHLFNPGESKPGIAAVFLAGMVFSYALWRTGSLWWAIGFHMAWDWAQSFLYGVPDSGFISAGRLLKTHPMGNPLLSGGTTGPEGSVYVLPTLLLVIVIIRFTTRPGVQPALEPLPTAPILPPGREAVIA